MSSKTSKFESLLEAVPDALVGMDQAGVIRFVNHQTELLFGYDRDDLIGAPLEILLPESLRPIHEVHRERYIAAPSTRTMGEDLELRGRRRDGTQFPVNIALSHTDTEDGPLAIAAVRDITNRKKTEEAHQQSERLAAIVEHSGDAIIGRGLDDAITNWNPAAERILGYSIQEVIGKSIDVLTPKDRAGEAKAIGAKVRAGKPVEHLETTRVRKDGTVIPVSITVSPIRDVDGAIVGTSTIARDRSEQVRADRMLADTSRQYRLLAENASDVVFRAGSDRRIVWIAPSVTAVLGWDPEELIGTQFADLLRPDYKIASAQDRVDLYTKGHDVSPEGGFLFELRTKSGDYRWVSGHEHALTDPDGTPLGVAAGLRDVNDLVKAREEAQGLSNALKTSNDSLRDFVAVASHDLRSPLVTIGGFAQILTDNWAKLSEEDRLKHLGVIKRGVDRLSRLTNDLLTLAKVEGEAEQTQPEHIRLATALASYLEANREELGTVAVTCPLELVAVVDPSHLTRILDNYVGNAFKYGDPPICIEAELVGDFVELRVRDHGPGVPPEFVSRLFTKFDRADTPTTRVTQGTGLGLSIVKALAEANHGDARYQPDEPNGGCFVVRLPAGTA
jgi:PAS domain S-box-containing protein